MDQSSPLVSSVLHIFPTLFECSFTSSPLVSSVVSHLLHSFRVYFFRLEEEEAALLKDYVEDKEEEEKWQKLQFTLARVKLHSKRVEKM